VTTTAPDHTKRPRIRQAERSDLLSVYRIEQTAFDQPWPFTAFEGYLGDEGFLVATGESVVGYIVADLVPAHGQDLGHIKDLAVHESRRGEGVGTQLLNRGLAILDSQGAHSVKLEVRETNESARSLYRRHGFEHRRTIPKYYSDGEDALVLVTAL
jgi:ribosomal-protein-alanine N-acetyltransferase